MGRLFLLLFLIHLALAFAAIVDCLGGERKPERWSRFVWSLLIVFGVLAGPFAWFSSGRPGRKLTVPWGLPGPDTGSSRPVAPDDDPDFIAGLGTTGRTGDTAPDTPPDIAPDAAPDERNNGPG